MRSPTATEWFPVPSLRALRTRSINPFASLSGNRKRQEPSDDGVMETWKILMLLMGKSTISTGPVSIAMLVYRRVMCVYIYMYIYIYK